MGLLMELGMESMMAVRLVEQRGILKRKVGKRESLLGFLSDCQELQLDSEKETMKGSEKGLKTATLTEDPKSVKGGGKESLMVLQKVL